MAGGGTSASRQTARLKYWRSTHRRSSAHAGLELVTLQTDIVNRCMWYESVQTSPPRSWGATQKFGTPEAFLASWQEKLGQAREDALLEDCHFTPQALQGQGHR